VSQLKKASAEDLTMQEVTLNVQADNEPLKAVIKGK